MYSYIHTYLLLHLPTIYIATYLPTFSQLTSKIHYTLYNILHIRHTYIGNYGNESVAFIFLNYCLFVIVKTNAPCHDKKNTKRNFLKNFNTPYSAWNVWKFVTDHRTVRFTYLNNSVNILGLFVYYLGSYDNV